MSVEEILKQYNDILISFDDLKLVQTKDFSKDFIVLTYDFVKNAENELKIRGYNKELKLASLYKEEIFR